MEKNIQNTNSKVNHYIFNFKQFYAKPCTLYTSKEKMSEKYDNLKQ